MTLRDPADRLADLRRAFDDSFARAVTKRAEPGSRCLVVRLGAERFALAATDVLGVHVDRRIVPVPTEAALVLGIAGVRNRPLVVVDLAAALGAGRSSRRWRWLVGVADDGGRDEGFGLLIEALDGYRTVAPESVRHVSIRTAEDHVQALVSIDDALVPLVDVRSVIRTVTGARFVQGEQRHAE